jgi:hypothetical protein
MPSVFSGEISACKEAHVGLQAAEAWTKKSRVSASRVRTASGFEGDGKRMRRGFHIYTRWWRRWLAEGDQASGGARSMDAMVTGALSYLTPERGKCIDN